MRIALFDYAIEASNPIGSCHLRLLRTLCEEHEFTVFAVRFDNPCPDRITWVRVPVPMRPLFLLFVAYHLMAPLLFAIHLLLRNTRFDVVQVVESKLLFGDISYAHFCHRSYLARHWSKSRPSGVRGAARWLDHWFHSLLEPVTFKRVSHIVVPSLGLAREIEDNYPMTAGKLHVIVNAIDASAMERPVGFDRDSLRAQLGFSAADDVLLFVALGQFERKGLPVLLQALSEVRSERLKLLVVGGTPNLVAEYRARVLKHGLETAVVFAGFAADVRPFYWACDAFVLPSTYETFSLVTLEAAVTGLVTIVPRLHGVEEYARDGESAIIIEATVEATARGLSRYARMSSEQRGAMRQRAREAVRAYTEERFTNAWRTLYSGLDAPRP